MDDDGVVGVILIVENGLGLELAGRIVDGEGRRIGAAQRVGQRVLVVVSGGVGDANVRIRSSVLGDGLADGGVVSELRWFVYVIDGDGHVDDVVDSGVDVAVVVPAIGDR